MLEKKIEVRIADWLRREGWYVTNLVFLNGRGWPDLTAFKDQRVLLLEVKTEETRSNTSKQQRRVHADLNKHGQPVYVVATLEEVQSLVHSA